MGLEWKRVRHGRWVDKYVGPTPGNPYMSHYRQEYDNGLVLTKESQVAVARGAVILLGLWIIIAWAYIFIADYTWTTAAVVLGVLVLFSLFTVGIMRTGGIILRFALWAFLLVVMSAAFSMLWSAECEQLTSGLQQAAVLAMGVAWLYGAIKLFRLVF
ncbi:MULTISPECIES: hypothetical protein [Acidithiobacillus]|uniref:hypothetical protein n=1 Tax=Acidithiobacillus ferrivorans TaxID=160808 RepID=UPI001C070943|nr:hypothetical protein [Acidithiobacillus ferrivorans]MBU2851656.1 hypothetical protein [Acidithiobacillus ferrivorans]